jgi:hypothetical protein
MTKLDAEKLLRAGHNAPDEQRILFLNELLYEQRSLLTQRLMRLNFRVFEALDFLEVGGLIVWDALVKPLDVPREGVALAEYNRAVLKRINAAGLANRLGLPIAQTVEGLLVLVPVIVTALTERLESDAIRRTRDKKNREAATPPATTASDDSSES